MKEKLLEIRNAVIIQKYKNDLDSINGIGWADTSQLRAKLESVFKGDRFIINIYGVGLGRLKVKYYGMVLWKTGTDKIYQIFSST